MKNFSLKALSAFIFAAGLVVAGVAAPANAAASATWTNGQPTFTFGSTPAMDISFTPTDTSSSATFRQVALTVKDAQGQSMSLSSLITGSLAGCGLSSVGGTHVQIQSNTCTRVNTSPASYNLISLENAGGGGSGSAYGAFDISVLSGMATGLMPGNTYTIWIATMNDSTVVESATLSVTIPGGNNNNQNNNQVNVTPTANSSLTMNAATGALVAGSTVGITASGLQPTAAYTVVVESTPQTIGSGNAVNSSVNTTVTLPAGLEAGWHKITFSSTSSSGAAVTNVLYFKVSASGTLLSTSTTIPAELANTGINSATGISLLAGGLSLALVGAEMFMIARRKRSS